MNAPARSEKMMADGAIQLPYRLVSKESLTGGFTHAEHPLIRTLCDF